MSTTTVSTEYLIPEMTRLMSIARRELDRHTSDHGTCCWCHKRWPCPTACLAASTLDGL
ncbi:MAG: hypothetical protein ACRDNF_15720 [Streptosporangiaceae bacterium]